MYLSVMRARHLLPFLLVASAALALGCGRPNHSPATSPRPASAAAACLRGETEVFACDLTGGGSLAACGATASETLTVRLHGPADLEVAGERGSDTFTYYRYTRPLVSYQGLAFRDHTRQWFVYDESNQEDDPSAIGSSGIRLGPPGDDSTEIACATPARGSLLDLDAWVEPVEQEYPY